MRLLGLEYHQLELLLLVFDAVGLGTNIMMFGHQLVFVGIYRLGLGWLGAGAMGHYNWLRFD